ALFRVFLGWRIAGICLQGSTASDDDDDDDEDGGVEIFCISSQFSKLTVRPVA
ncbi:hypothetical protein RUM43_006179, partial [Polyplax serrata]